MKTAYRVNFPELEIGDPITSSEHFYSHLNEEREEVEEVFEERRPSSKPSRINAIFAFEDESTAKSWMAIKHGHHLYRISVDEDDILHIGDWKWLEIARNGNVKDCADKYWASENSDNPLIEWIIREGINEAEIEISGLDRRRLLEERWNW
ncbi:MAG: hypothetical protein IH852_00360 [Bacteroidetes bacterium]|nr:hypothetical protein [Bacteroidota bacterium]